MHGQCSVCVCVCGVSVRPRQRRRRCCTANGDVTHLSRQRVALSHRGNPRTLGPTASAACPRPTHNIAERRLLSAWVEEARKAGQRPHQVVAWVRRKAGGAVCVWRLRRDGSLGCSVPCVCCSRELLKFGLKVYCVSSDGAWFDGWLDEPGAPRSQPTSGQRRELNFVGRPPHQQQGCGNPKAAAASPAVVS